MSKVFNGNDSIYIARDFYGKNANMFSLEVQDNSIPVNTQKIIAFFNLN